MPTDFDASEFFDLFVQEATEQIDALDQAVISLEQEDGARDAIEVIFRAAHSLKAAAASQGCEDMSHMSHALENVFDRIRNNVLQISPELIDRLLEGIDALKEYLRCAVSGETPSAWDELLKSLRAIADGDAGNAAQSAVSVPAATDVSTNDTLPDEQECTSDDITLQLKLDETCAMPSARAWLLLQQMSNYGDVLNSKPSLEDLKNADLTFDCIEITIATTMSNEEILHIASRMPDVCEVSLLTAQQDAPEHQNEAATVLEHEDQKAAGHPNTEATRHQATQATVRVNVENIDALMALVGELVISRTRLTNLTQNLKEHSIGEVARISQNLEQVSANLGMIVTELQERVMKTRMVPVSQVFGRFPRLVRDVARREAKQVDLVIDGGDTELDRSVIEDIVDPLTHLLRNAVGHGVETPEKRAAAGKPEKGIVRLSARQEQSMVVIEVSDDGGGMDPDVLRRKAVEKGLMSEQQAAATTDHQILDIIFAAGFSTASEVSDVSGRGVGMDVVKNNIDKIGGLIEIESDLGHGTRISLRLPLTLAIIQGLLVTCADVIFALPITSVVRILRSATSDLQSVNNCPMLVVGGDALPVISLAEVSGFRKFQPQSADTVTAVVVSDGREKIAIAVDDIIGNEELVIQPLGELLQDSRVVTGAAILGDGRLALIADVTTIIRIVSEKQVAA